MKILKILGGTIISLVIILLIAAMIAPSENHVERSVMINAPGDAVRANVMSFEGMLKWSPWHDRDPDQEYSIENDGQVGALYHWSGADSLVGEGTQTITSMSDNEVVTHLHFIRPWESDADAVTSLEETENGVKVTWSYSDHTPYPMNVMNLMFDLDEMLGPDFQEGMDRLKTLVEEEASSKTTFRDLEVKVEELSPRTYIGVMDTLSWEELEAFFQGTF
ncbi:MAG: SRPBCC family protein, partial [Cryomorphaceae bacterium]